AAQVPARHTFHRKHREPPHHQRAAQHLVGDARVIRRSGQVVGSVDEAEEEHAHRGQDAALVRDRAVQDVVVRRDPVGRHQQQVLVVDAVDLADLAAGQVLVVGQCGTHRASLSGAVRPTRRWELCWYEAMTSPKSTALRILPYSTRPGRLAVQLFSDFAIFVWTAIWLLVGTAVYDAISTIAAAGRQVENGANGIAGNLASAGHGAPRHPGGGDGGSKPPPSAQRSRA